jgi:hypothetical protein
MEAESVRERPPEGFRGTMMSRPWEAGSAQREAMMSVMGIFVRRDKPV